MMLQECFGRIRVLPSIFITSRTYLQQFVAHIHHSRKFGYVLGKNTNLYSPRRLISRFELFVNFLLFAVT